MRGLIAAPCALMVVAALAPVSACKRKSKVPVRPPEDDGQLVSMVHVADPRSSVQLLRGFYSVESNAWRWAASRFAVSLKTPQGAAQNGGRVLLKFVLPDVIFQKLGPQSIRASVGGSMLAAQTFSQAGEHTYSADVPAALLSRDIATVDFTCEKFIPPGDDIRELAIIVTTVGLESK